MLPRHIADLQIFPKEVVNFLKAGGFTVKLTDRLGHAVALDEAHEMCINHDIKMAVTRPTTAYLKKATSFFSYRIKSQKLLTSQLFPTTTVVNESPTIYDSSNSAKRWEENVLKMGSLIREQSIFETELQKNRSVINLFTKQEASPEQAHDMLAAHQIGKQVYNNYITHHLLQLPSVLAPIRRKQLLTMAPPKSTKRRISQLQREQRDTNKYLRKRLAWCNRTGQTFDESQEQYSLLPRSLAEADGTLHKGVKSKWTDKLQARYEKISFISTLEWVPEVVIIDAMFIINTNPLRQHTTLLHYSEFLFKQYAVPHFACVCNQVHLSLTIPQGRSSIPRIVSIKDDIVNQQRVTENMAIHVFYTLRYQTSQDHGGSTWNVKTVKGQSLRL